MPAQPAKADCANKLPTGREGSEEVALHPTDSSLGQGAWFCLRYGQDHVAAVQAKKLSSDASSITLFYTIWPE